MQGPKNREGMRGRLFLPQIAAPYYYASALLRFGVTIQPMFQ